MVTRLGRNEMQYIRRTQVLTIPSRSWLHARRWQQSPLSRTADVLLDPDAADVPEATTVGPVALHLSRRRISSGETGNATQCGMLLGSIPDDLRCNVHAHTSRPAPTGPDRRHFHGILHIGPKCAQQNGCDRRGVQMIGNTKEFCRDWHGRIWGSQGSPGEIPIIQVHTAFSHLPRINRA